MSHTTFLSRRARYTRRLIPSSAASLLARPDTCRLAEWPGRGQLGGLHVQAGQAPVQPCGQPPVGPPEQVHHRWHEDGADEVGVDETGGGETEADLLDGHRAADDARR